MASELSPIDISTIPELAHLAEEVRTTRQPRVLRRGDEDVAILLPARSRAPRRPATDQSAPARPLRFPKGGVVAATAGIVQYDGPPLTIEQEREAFEQGVADEVMASLGV